MIPLVRLRVERRMWSNRFEFLLGSRRAYVEPVKWVEEKEDEVGLIRDPTFTLEHEQTQELMDSLWAAGLRPSEGSGSAGALAATQRHLEDMRRLVFKEVKL